MFNTNKQLPHWYNEFIEHYNYYNNGCIEENEMMSIQFIPKNNKLLVKQYYHIMDELRKLLVRHNYDIQLLERCEGGFQFVGEYYKPKENFELQIRCNLHLPLGSWMKGLKMDDELLPQFKKFNKANINIFEFTGYYNIPRKIMLHLYRILDENDMLIYKTYNFPNQDDEIIWNTKSIWYDPCFNIKGK